jgi:hypothetical protein
MEKLLDKPVFYKIETILSGLLFRISMEAKVPDNIKDECREMFIKELMDNRYRLL